MLLGAAHLVVAGRIDDVDQVEVSIADMTDQRRVQAGRLQVLLGLDDALGQPRDRHADVGRPALAAGPLCQRRIECVVPRLPQLDRKSVVWGKSVSVRVDIGGRRIIKKKTTKKTNL